MKMLRILFFAILLASSFTSVVTAQAVPRPNYRVYGSVARQMTVYRNIRETTEQLSRNQYRRFRREVRRDVAQQPRTRYIIPRTTTRRVYVYSRRM